MNRSKAFTLLELLVVMAIIAILLSILMPVFSSVRMHAKRDRCLSNHHQIAAVIMIYAADNTGAMPTADPPFKAGDESRDGAGLFNRQLNPYLKSMTYEVLHCPADRGGAPFPGVSYFESDGRSYQYMASAGLGSQGISGVVGGVLYQEPVMGLRPSITLDSVRNALGYSGKGPEDIPDPDGGRTRDITQQEIDEIAWPYISNLLAGTQGQSGFNINSSQYRWRKTITSYQVYNSSTGKWEWHKFTRQSEEGSQGPSQYVNDTGSADYGMPAPVDANGDPIAGSSPEFSPNRWNYVNFWSRNVTTADYWTRSSKKVMLLDRDAYLAMATPSADDRSPPRGRGFWHGYNYVPDPDDMTNMDKYRVKVHACFLDGHAEAIELNQYSDVSRDHIYY